MKKVLGGLFFLFVSSYALAVTISQPINLNARHEWRLKNPLPDNIFIPAQDKKRKIVLHVNKYLKSNSSLPSDPVELTCGNEHIVFRAGATGSCDLPTNIAASFGIKANDFHNGSDGVIIYVE